MKKVVLVIRDGWGYRKSHKDNAIAQANTSFTDKIMEKYPHVLLDASWEAVGLPDGYMWNSEVWHMTIWSGRIIDQSLTRIHRAIVDKSFFQNKLLSNLVSHCKKNWNTLHLMWLLQVEGVHAHMEHLFALLDFCKLYDFHDVVIHIFTDGRDAPVYDAKKHIDTLENKLKNIWFGQIMTVMWRFYAMDRNHRWERTQKAYDAIINGNVSDGGVFTTSASDAIQRVYDNQQETDEFIRPMKYKDYHGVADGDAMIFWNFRTDRTRQLTQMILEKQKNIRFVAMTQYYDDMHADVIFPEIPIKNLLWELVSNAGYRQLRISETEKYAHVTFFMNGQRDKAFLNEDRILIDSPQVENYKDTPAMSIDSLSIRLCENISKEKYQLIIVNFVNGDMVWHTGDVDAIQKAVEAVDHSLEKTVSCALEHDYILMVTADHGNVEDQREEWRTSHTTNPVPFILIWRWLEKIQLRTWWGLKDIAPTILEFLDINKPKDMTGDTLVR